MIKKQVLIADDVVEYVQSLGRALSLEYEIAKAFSLEEAQKNINNAISLALVDIRLSEDDMANRDGILFLGWFRENLPAITVLFAWSTFHYAFFKNSAIDA